MKTSRKVVGLCAQSGKYREQDCERKWQECLRKHDGRTTIASFYKMAQQAGVDLSAIGRQFFSKFSNSHGSSVESQGIGNKNDNSFENTINKGINPIISPHSDQQDISSDGCEKMRKVRISEAPDMESDSEKRFSYSETFSDKLTADRYLGEFTNKYHLTLRIFNGRYRKNIPK